MKTANEILTGLTNAKVLSLVNQVFDTEELEGVIEVIIPGSQGVDAHLLLYSDDRMGVVLYEYIMNELVGHFQDLHEEFEEPFNLDYYRKLQREILYLFGRKLNF